jgi:hypothetical protein
MQPHAAISRFACLGRVARATELLPLRGVPPYRVGGDSALADMRFSVAPDSERAAVVWAWSRQRQRQLLVRQQSDVYSCDRLSSLPVEMLQMLLFFMSPEAP